MAALRTPLYDTLAGISPLMVLSFIVAVEVVDESKASLNSMNIAVFGLTPVFRLDGWISITCGGMLSGLAPTVNVHGASMDMTFPAESRKPAFIVAV